MTLKALANMGTLIRRLLLRLGLFGRFMYTFGRGFIAFRAIFLIIAAIFTDAEIADVFRNEMQANANIENTLWMLGFALFFLLDVYTLWYIGRFLMKYLHRRHCYRKLVHLQVLLPKNDSKLDNEKRTEKDFHEVIGRMEQFFRALHETRDLSLYNKLFNRTLWGMPHMSFELQFEAQEMRFVIVCHPYYKRIIEKQITSFYESAEIQPIKPKNQFRIDEAGYHYNGYYLHTKEDFWYPIQTYKQIEDDALNDVANSFAKFEKTDKGVIQMVVSPTSRKWKKTASEEGTRLFKGQKKKKWRIPFIGAILLPIFQIFWLPIKVFIAGYNKETDTIGNNAPGADSGDSYVRMLSTEEEVAKAIGEKAIQSGYCTSIRVMAASKSAGQVPDMLNGMFVAFNVFKGKGKNAFENKRALIINTINKQIIKHGFKYRLWDWNFLEKDSLLCEEELATIFHFPDAKYNKIPTIKWMDYKVLPPPINLPKEGVVLGNSVYRGESKPVRIMPNDRTRHMYVIGKSGSGKSVLLEYMAGQDVQRGAGVCVIDPHGDLVEDVLSRAPKERAKEIIVFDPGDMERPMGLNVLEAKTEEERDRASLDAMEIFIKLFGNEIFGPRIQHYFRNGCLTLMADQEEGATLIDIPRLFIDDDFQRYKVSKLQNPMVRAFWENEMANTGEREKQEMIPYFTSKFGPFVTNTTMRNIIGQTKSAFNVRESMDTEKVLLINLSKGKIGAINAQLLGLIMVAKINQAAMGRADMAKEDRKDFYLYVDEFQNFATDTFAAILSEARKYRLNLIMAHQYIAQLSEGAGGVAVGQKDSKIRDAVFGNVGTMMNFKVGAEDAEYFEKEYSPVLSQQDILGIANYKAYIKLNINNTTSRPFSLETIWDPDGRNYKIAEIIKKYARMKYGRKKEFVDAEIEARMGINNLNKIEKTAQADPAIAQVAAQKEAALPSKPNRTPKNTASTPTASPKTPTANNNPQPLNNDKTTPTASSPTDNPFIKKDRKPVPKATNNPFLKKTDPTKLEDHSLKAVQTAKDNTITPKTDISETSKNRENDLTNTAKATPASSVKNPFIKAKTSQAETSNNSTKESANNEKNTVSTPAVADTKSSTAGTTKESVAKSLQNPFNTTNTPKAEATESTPNQITNITTNNTFVKESPNTSTQANNVANLSQSGTSSKAEKKQPNKISITLPNVVPTAKLDNPINQNTKVTPKAKEIPPENQLINGASNKTLIATEAPKQTTVAVNIKNQNPQSPHTDKENLPQLPQPKVVTSSNSQNTNIKITNNTNPSIAKTMKAQVKNPFRPETKTTEVPTNVKIDVKSTSPEMATETSEPKPIENPFANIKPQTVQIKELPPATITLSEIPNNPFRQVEDESGTDKTNLQKTL